LSTLKQFRKERVQKFWVQGFKGCGLWREISEVSNPSIALFEYRISNKEFRMMKFSFTSTFNILDILRFSVYDICLRLSNLWTFERWTFEPGDWHL